MAPIRQNYVYKESRLDLDPATQGSFISIRLPTPGAPLNSQKSPPKRSYVSELPLAEDENTFRQYNLATSASIYNRVYHKSPRSFLWRVLEDEKVLSLRAVDVSRHSNVADANLTLRLIFPHSIKPGCIAFSDSKDHDVLSVFVLLETRHVYTLTLRPDFFRKVSSTEDTAADWCKVYLSPTLTFKHAHRMVALDADQLLLAFYDGALLRLERNSGGDGAIPSFMHRPF
jgi:nuclear pore complex protein Nup160